MLRSLTTGTRPTASSEPPAVSLVVATRNRARRLASLLTSLEEQTFSGSFEVIVVNDGSADETHELLDRWASTGPLPLRALHRVGSGGPGMARNDGWRESRAELIAFIDDDCVAAPGWLATGAAASRANPGSIIQGQTDPIPAEEAQAGPFSYTLRIRRLGPHYETCNIFYPRDLLERLGGFDTDAFPGGGEDADLAWRAIEEGASTAFAPEAQVFHAVHELGPVGHLKRAWHWSDTMLAFARHQGLRDGHLFRGAFWKLEHYGLIRALSAALMPKSLRLLRRWFVWRYTGELGRRGVAEGRGLWGLVLIPYLLLHDVVEVIAVVRGAIRYRTLVL